MTMRCHGALVGLVWAAALAVAGGCVLEPEGEDPGCNGYWCNEDCVADGFGGGGVCEGDSCRCIPAGSGCDGSACNADCVSMGNALGHCEGDGCVCVPAGTSCSPGVCNSDCVAWGNASGYCDGDTCVCVPASGPECTTHAQCDAQSLCIAEHCVLAYGRDYRITIYSASGIPENNFTGEAWDFPGGLPDPFIVFYVVGVGHWQTSVVNDTLSPVWNESIDSVRINESTRVRMEMWDPDLTDHDTIIGIWDDADAIPVDVAWLKDGGFSIEGEGVRMDFYIDPL